MTENKTGWMAFPVQMRFPYWVFENLMMLAHSENLTVDAYIVNVLARHVSNIERLDVEVKVKGKRKKNDK